MPKAQCEGLNTRLYKSRSTVIYVPADSISYAILIALTMVRTVLDMFICCMY